MFGRRQGLLVGASATALIISVWVLVGCVPVALPTVTPEPEIEGEAAPTVEMEAEETATPSEETADLTPEPGEEAADLTPEPGEEGAETPTPSAEEETEGGETDATPEAEEETEGEADATPEPEEEASGGGQSSGGGVDFAAIFPAGFEAETDMLLFNCGSCHSWVCAVIEQRPETHWNTVQASHRDRVSGLSDSEYEELFAFLKANFNDQQPEPELPPELRSLGCTTQ